MTSLLNKIKAAGSATSSHPAKRGQSKKDDGGIDGTPLERMLQNAGPLRDDGSDRFFGFENFGNTCYCNSIVQALFYSDLFRQSVINYPPHSPLGTPNGVRPKVNVSIRPPMYPSSQNAQPKQKVPPSPQARQRQAVGSTQSLLSPPIVKPEDKPDTPEYKKKQAMLKGPILELAQENAVAYGMEECTFTGLKDVFLALIESRTRTGVLSPQRFLEIFKRDNEMFRNSMHQDAHEFYGLVLNDVIANVEANARRKQQAEDRKQAPTDLTGSVEHALLSHAAPLLPDPGQRSPGTGWVHDIFEGLLTSETQCLTCGTTSQRDETFLDLSIDLDEHSSVTACLRKFSAKEMLCERNKFHCDQCGGLQEAEKRIKVKRLPKVLTLHLKRFKYTEDHSRLQKLFHRVVYPYNLRMFNTTDDAEDPDRLYELYAVVVHIGGNAYHGHYVSIIKTRNRSWLLFDDEMVEPVDKHFVRNFFGDKLGMATAYVLFYQETTFDAMREEQEREGTEEVRLATQAADLAHGETTDKADTAPLQRLVTQPAAATTTTTITTITTNHVDASRLPKLTPIKTAPDAPVGPSSAAVLSSPTSPASPPPIPALTGSTTAKAQQHANSKEVKRREKKEREAAEKANRQAVKEREKQAKAAAKEAGKEGERHAREVEEQRRTDQQNHKTTPLHHSVREERPNPAVAAATTARRADDDNRAATATAAASSVDGASPEHPKRSSRTLTRKSFSFFHHRDKPANDVPIEPTENGRVLERMEKTRGRLSLGLLRKKSTNLLS